MARVIRNCKAGDQIPLSDWLREYGPRDRQDSPAETQRRAQEQALLEAVQMQEQAAALLTQAEAKAMEICTEAEIQASTLQAEAQARGYEEGYKQGIADAQQKTHAAFAHYAAQIQKVLAGLAEQRNAILANAETEVATLSMAIAEKIVGHIAQTYQPLILYTTSRAVAQVTGEGTITVHLHPDDRQILEEFWQHPDQSDADPPDTWKLVADPQIDRGGCLLTCGPTTVDARLATQLQSLVDGLQIPNYVVGERVGEKPSPPL